jgi:hypothetical protein
MYLWAEEGASVRQLLCTNVPISIWVCHSRFPVLSFVNTVGDAGVFLYTRYTRRCTQLPVLWVCRCRFSGSEDSHIL